MEESEEQRGREGRSGSEDGEGRRECKTKTKQ